MRAAGLACALAATSACRIPEKQLVEVDAPGAPFACLNQPLPTTAPGQITIAGSVINPVSGSPLANTAVEGFLVGTPTAIFTVMTGADGSFSRDQGTGGVPRDVYLKSAPNGYLPTYYHPAVPLARDHSNGIQQLTMQDVMTIASVAQITIDTAKANFLVTVTDCNGMPLPGATVTTVPAGTVRYFVNASPSPDAVATDASTGAALVANVTPSNTTIQAMVNGMTLRSHNLDGVAGAIMQTEIQP